MIENFLQKNITSGKWTKILRSDFRFWLKILQFLLIYFSQSNEITEPLTPLVQVASLLQARKETDQDVQVILEICSTLSTAQVIKVKLPDLIYVMAI